MSFYGNCNCLRHFAGFWTNEHSRARCFLFFLGEGEGEEEGAGGGGAEGIGSIQFSKLCPVLCIFWSSKTVSQQKAVSCRQKLWTKMLLSKRNALFPNQNDHAEFWHESSYGPDTLYQWKEPHMFRIVSQIGCLWFDICYWCIRKCTLNPKLQRRSLSDDSPLSMMSWDLPVEAALKTDIPFKKKKFKLFVEHPSRFHTQPRNYATTVFANPFHGILR